MGLWCSQLLHHLLQLHHIDVVVLFQVVPSNRQVLLVSLSNNNINDDDNSCFFFPFPGSFQKEQVKAGI